MTQHFSPATVAKVFAMWVLLFISLPLSPLYLIATLVYQIGCVSGKLPPTSRVATFVVCAFLCVAWIPFLCFLFYLQLDKELRQDKGVMLDGILPICTLVVFYLWGSVVAYRVYSIDDSYEEERDRAFVRRLQQFPLEPTIMFRSQQHGTESELANAYDLYMALKRENPENATAVAVCVGLVLSATTMVAARVTQAHTSENSLYQTEPTYTLSSIYFSGMFLVFFSSLAFVATLYINHVRIVWQLTFLASGEDISKASAVASPMSGLDVLADGTGTGTVFVFDDADPPDVEVDAASDDGSRLQQSATTALGSEPLVYPVSAPTMAPDEDYMQSQLSVGGSVALRRGEGSVGGISVSMQPYNMGHIRAWDEVRRVAAAYIGHPESTLNAFLTPSLWLTVFGMAAAYIYLVISSLVNFSTVGPFVVASISFLVIFAFFFLAMVAIAKKARRHFKFHNVIISRVIFDVACEIDQRMPLVQQGIEKVEDRRPGMESLELLDLERLHDSLLALLAYMDSTSPRPLILGIEQRHVRYAVAYALLASANVLFVALLNAVVQNKCFGDNE